MTRKLSLSALAITLVLLVSVVTLCVRISCGRVNALVQEELASICRLSAARLDSAAFTDEEEESLGTIRSISASTQTEIHLFDIEGNDIFSTRKQDDPLTEIELAQTIRDGSAVFRREHTSFHRTFLYAAMQLDSGEIVRVSRAAETVSSVFGLRVFGLYGGAVLISLFIYTLVRLYCMRARRIVSSMVSVLEDFTDGDFDSRIPQNVAVTAGDVAHFNAVLGRLQDRVFRQSTRNHALNAVMNSMETGMLAVDKDLHILIITPVAKRLLGVTGSPDNVPISQAIHDVNLEEIFHEAMQQEGVYVNSVAARTAVGRGKRPLKLYVSSMRGGDGDTEGAVALIEDVTELRRLEQVRNDFVANVSHELKTPLTSIKGFVETLQAGAINNPEMAERFLNIINLETDRLTRLINDILSISKLESGDKDLPKERVDLKRFAADTCDMLRLHASLKDVTITFNATDESCFVLGNPDRVRQMLINLIENAIKYNKDGGRVNVSVQAAGDNVNFTCADTGIGIPEEHLPRLFERFYRVDKGRSRSMGGTGLGLAIVKHIVNSLGGMIEVQSKFGEGTEFLVTLPRVPAETAEETSVRDDPFSGQEQSGEE